MPHVSDPADLALHGPRVLGFTGADAVAARFGLDPDLTEEHLLDFEALGWVARTEFAGTAGWHLTERGRAENERRLAVELDRAGARDLVVGVHAGFVPVNARFTRVVTRWQLRPHRGDPLAVNDHTDWAWDEDVLRGLRRLGTDLAGFTAQLTARLPRFDGYAQRYEAALHRVDQGQRHWVDDPSVASCHTVWLQFHEDLIATLGLTRDT